MAYTTDANESIADDHEACPIADYIRLGTDNEGADHVYDRQRDAIHVVGVDGGREVYRLAETPIDGWGAWVETHVPDKRGWADLSLHAAVFSGWA
jgi:hypothetical protein